MLLVIIILCQGGLCIHMMRCVHPRDNPGGVPGGRRGLCVVVLVRQHLSAQAVAELSFMRSQLCLLRLAPGVDRRIVSFGASEEFRTGDVYRMLHASGSVVPNPGLNWENFVPPQVHVFFWILRLGKTRTHTHLFCLGCVSSPTLPLLSMASGRCATYVRPVSPLVSCVRSRCSPPTHLPLGHLGSTSRRAR
jgi:hypothetical protein